jgi:hypothetical protein
VPSRYQHPQLSCHRPLASHELQCALLDQQAIFFQFSLQRCGCANRFQILVQQGRRRGLESLR